MPALPDETLETLTRIPYHLTMKDAKTLMSLDDGLRLDYYLSVVDCCQNRAQSTNADKESSSRSDLALPSSVIGKTAGNW